MRAPVALRTQLYDSSNMQALISVPEPTDDTALRKSQRRERRTFNTSRIYGQLSRVRLYRPNIVSIVAERHAAISGIFRAMNSTRRFQ
jgi:hypothetical protein